MTKEINDMKKEVVKLPQAICAVRGCTSRMVSEAPPGVKIPNWSNIYLNREGSMMRKATRPIASSPSKVTG